MSIPLTDLEEAIAAEVVGRLAARFGKTVHTVHLERIGTGPASALMLGNTVLAGSPTGDVRIMARALVDRLDGTAPREESETQDCSDLLPDEEMLTTEQTAERLGVKPITIIRACVGKRIPGARKHGRDWVIPAASLPLAQVSAQRGRRRKRDPLK